MQKRGVEAKGPCHLPFNFSLGFTLLHESMQSPSMLGLQLGNPGQTLLKLLPYRCCEGKEEVYNWKGTMKGIEGVEEV